ncbi:testis-expressed protein 15 [Petaurus breviceps papuanus]|uniref:testis-expressed protein 15 n=1 Tax=Petaurus breviceps papuanus TaxID=3040969 RepID=UPI0036DC2DA0
MQKPVVISQKKTSQLRLKAADDAEKHLAPLVPGMGTEWGPRPAASQGRHRYDRMWEPQEAWVPVLLPGQVASGSSLWMTTAPSPGAVGISDAGVRAPGGRTVHVCAYGWGDSRGDVEWTRYSHRPSEYEGFGQERPEARVTARFQDCSLGPGLLQWTQSALEEGRLGAEDEIQVACRVHGFPGAGGDAQDMALAGILGHFLQVTQAAPASGPAEEPASPLAQEAAGHSFPRAAGDILPSLWISVYFYEYNTLSKPVDRPRQCLPYATVTVRFLGQKAGSEPTITSLRFLSEGFPAWPEERGSLKNCTIAKRIGKGKDATVIYEHFPKPTDPSAQNGCCCAAEMNSWATDGSSPLENVQNNRFFAVGPVDHQTEHGLAEGHNLSQVQTTEARLPLPPSGDAAQSVNGDLLINLEKFLATLSAAVALPNSIGASTVTTSKLIKDPRLLKRGAHDQANPETGSGETLPLESREESPGSEANPSPSLPAHAALPSGAAPPEPTELHQVSPFPEGMFYQDGAYGAISQAASDDAKEGQPNSDLQVPLPESENQECSDKEMHSSGQTNRILLPFKKQARGKYIPEMSHFPRKGMPRDTSPKRLSNPKTWKLQPAEFQTVHERLRPPSPPEPLQAQQETRDKSIQDTQNTKSLNTDTEKHSKEGRKKYTRKKDSYDCTHGEGRSLRDFNLPHEKHKTWILSRQDYEACKKPQSQGPAVQMQASPPPPEQEEKSNSKHPPRKSENSYPPAGAQKSSKNCLEEWLRCERMYINKHFSKSPKVTELKTGRLHVIPIGTKVDAPQDMDSISQSKEKPHDLINLSLDTKVPHFEEIRDEKGKCPLVHRGNENEPVSPAGSQQNGRLNDCLVEEVARSQDCPVFCDPVFGDDDASFPDLNVCFQEPEFRSEESDDPHPKREGRQSPFVEKNRMENIYVDEKQVVHMNKTCTAIVSDEREIKNLGSSAGMYSEKFSSTFSLAWKKSCVSTEAALVESENRVTPGNQGESLLSDERKLMPQVATLSEATGSCASHIHKDSGTSMPFPAAQMPGPSTGYEDHQGEFLGLDQTVQSPSFGAWGRNVFEEHGDNLGYSKPNEGCELPTISKDLTLLFPQDLAFDNEIELEFEQCEGSLLQQDTTIHSGMSADEMSSLYQMLESRIDWKNVFESKSWKSSEGSESCVPQEDGSQCFLRESSCIYSYTQRNPRELFCPEVVPDLQIQITNIIQSGIALCQDPDISEAEMSDAWQESEPVASSSQFTCENIDRPGEELSVTVCSEASEPRGNLVLSPLPDPAVKAGENPQVLSPQPAATSQTTKNQSTCPQAKPRDAHNKIPRVKHGEPKRSKGKAPASLKDKIMPSRNFRYPEPCDLTRETTPHQSSEQFSSLSEGRIKTFSQSERHIQNVLNALYSEASLCKSKRLSRKLDQAVLHLKKAHRKVHRSLQLITKVGEKRRNSPLPKSYEVIRNSLWECCDLEGYNFLTERRYYSRHYWQKRKDDRQEEKRTLGLEVVWSQTPASDQQGCGSSSKDQGARRSLSTEGPSSETSVSHVSTLRSANPDRLHHSASRGSASSRGTWKDPRRSDHKVPGEQSHHSDRERSFDFVFLSSIHTEERSERPLSDLTSRKASSPPHSAPSRMERNVKFSNGLGEKSLPLDPNKPNIEGDGETHSRGNSDLLFVSVLKSSTEHFFNVDASATDHLKLPRDPPKLEGHLPAEKLLAAAVSLKPSSGSEHLVGGSDSTAPWTRQEGDSGLQNFSCISVKNNTAEWWTPHSKKLSKGLPIGDGLATHTLSLQQEQPPLPNDGEDALDTTWEPCKNSPQRGDRKEGSGSESAIMGPAPLEKNKICKKNAVESLPLNTSLENTRNSSSQKPMVKKEDKEIQMKPAEKEQQPEKPMEEASVLPGTPETFIQMEGQDKQGQALDSSVVALSCGRVTPSLLARTEEEEGRMEAEHETILFPSTPPATIMGDPAPGRKGVSQTGAIYMHLGIPEVGPAQQSPPTSESEEDQSSEDPTTLIMKLSRILQKADKASTLKSLQEQIKTCQNVLPLFIEAFERKQKCSFKHVLISRDLLVEGNGWSNCRRHLHPGAVDSLVELQMMMETMQFIENKKGLLGREPTFRSLLWYDASLYSELFRGDQGYQQQSCLYPAFQDRLKYNTLSELQHYHGQLTKLLEEARKDNKSYYAVLKYRRQIEECEDIMKRCSNYFDFTLSAPFTCGVNFGDNLEDLEMLRKSTLELISNQDHFPKIQFCPGKQDHLWIIMEMISSKMHFIKNSESVSMKVSLYGLEHIFFDAAKSLVWKERGLSIGRNDSPQRMKEEELTFNQRAVKKLQQIYETVEAKSKAEHAATGWLEETVGNIPSKHCDCLKEEGLGRGSFRFNDTLFSLPDICRVGEILDQAESADLKQLEELRVRCRDHLETLKKCFQILQEASVDSVLITEDTVLDVASKPSHPVVLLKPEAVEMYIEVVMLAETIHFLKNIMAKKLGQPRFRGMLWFDLSLLPELIENQEKTASFSFVRENAAACLWEAVEAAILELKGDATVICEYPEGANSAYALQLLSRELAELSEIRILLEQATPPITTYTDLVPYTMSVNYGTTLSELEHNYNQFAVLLKNLTLASQKDLGKMAHVMKIMKTIEHLKVSCVQMGSCDISLLTCQMFSNAEKAHQQEKEKTRVIPKKKSRKVTRKRGPSRRASASRSGEPLKDPVVSIKRCFLCESSQEHPDPPSCKKTKMGGLLPTDFKKPKQLKGPLQEEREKTADGGAPLDLDPPPCLTQTRQGSPGPSCLLPQQDLVEDSPPTAEDTAGQQGNLTGMRGRDPSGSLRKRSWSEGILPGAPDLTAHLRSAPRALQASFHSGASLHSAAAAEDLSCVRADCKVLLDGTSGIHALTVILPGHEAVVLQPACPSPTISSQPGLRAEPANQVAPGPHEGCPFSQQQQPKDMPRASVPASGGWASQGAHSPTHPHSSWPINHSCGSSSNPVTQTQEGTASNKGQPLPAAPVCHVPAADPPRSSLGQLLLPGQGLGLCASHGALPAPPRAPCSPHPGACRTRGEYCEASAF